MKYSEHKMKLLAFRSRERLSWQSCQSISSGLQSVYDGLNTQVAIHWVELSPSQFMGADPRVASEMISVARLINEFKPDRLVFVDQMPLPPVILSYLHSILSYDRLPPVIIHLYGDFTFFAANWSQCLSQATGLRMHFITASHNQDRLIRYFLGDNASTSVCHFPVGNGTLFSPELRNRIRDKEKVKPHIPIMAYAGRIHIQKNVDTLIKAFAQYNMQNPSSENRLWIAGDIDDLGGRSLGLKAAQGQTYRKIRRLLSQLPQSIANRIKLFGWLDKNSLHEFLCGSDLFASLSLYHDEDFGMSPAEALANGLSTILSDWGGYPSFVSESGEWDCRLLRAELTDFGFKLDLAPLLNAMSEDFQNPDDRQKRGSVFQNNFSVEAAQIKIADILKILPPPLESLNWKLPHFAKHVNYEEMISLAEEDFFPSSNSYYAEVYSNYLRRERP